MSQLDHWPSNDVCLEKRGYAASICLAQVTWRIARLLSTTKHTHTQVGQWGVHPTWKVSLSEGTEIKVRDKTPSPALKHAKGAILDNRPYCLTAKTQIVLHWGQTTNQTTKIYHENFYYNNKRQSDKANITLSRSQTYHFHQSSTAPLRSFKVYSSHSVHA